MRFGRKGKPSPQFIRPYEIIERVLPLAYHLALPPRLEKIHDVFHVSMLRRYRSELSHVITPAEVEILLDMTYGQESINILAQEAIWELEVSMREQYPNLFAGKIFEDENP